MKSELMMDKTPLKHLILITNHGNSLLGSEKKTTNDRIR